MTDKDVTPNQEFQSFKGHWNDLAVSMNPDRGLIYPETRRNKMQTYDHRDARISNLEQYLRDNQHVTLASWMRTCILLKSATIASSVSLVNFPTALLLEYVTENNDQTLVITSICNVCETIAAITEYAFFDPSDGEGALILDFDKFQRLPLIETMHIPLHSLSDMGIKTVVCRKAKFD